MTISQGLSGSQSTRSGRLLLTRQCNCITMFFRIWLTNLEVLMVRDLIQAESTLTDRYQTTIPDSVRKALGLNKRDKINYAIGPNGQVIISKADQPEDDPVLGQFLDFIVEDIKKNPTLIQAISSAQVNRVQSLVADVEFDLDAPLSEEDE